MLIKITFIHLHLGWCVPGQLSKRVWSRIGYSVRGVRGGSRCLLALWSGSLLHWRWNYAGPTARPLLADLLGIHQSSFSAGNMTRSFGPWTKISHKYSPWVIYISYYYQTIFIFSFLGYEEMLGEEYKYPEWSIRVGWALTCSSILCIPIYIVYRLFCRSEGKCSSRLKQSFKADMNDSTIPDARGTTV